MRKFLITVNDQQYEVGVEEVKSTKNSKPATAVAAPSVASPAKAAAAPSPVKPGHSTTKINSPMPGSILKVNVKAGDTVKRGQALLILEAMKMENEISSPADGKVVEVKVSVGQSVNLGQLLIEIG